MHRAVRSGVSRRAARARHAASVDRTSARTAHAKHRWIDRVGSGGRLDCQLRMRVAEDDSLAGLALGDCNVPARRLRDFCDSVHADVPCDGCDRRKHV